MKTLLFINIFVLSVIWIVSGISSILNIEQSRELIGLIGINGISGDTLIYLAAAGDILLGVLVWFSSLRKAVIYFQIAVMLIYSIIVSLFIPSLLLHPFAPVLKNLAMFVLAFYILAEEKE